MYFRPVGLAQDYAKAVSLYGKAIPLFRQACEAGDAGSCANLAEMYSWGRGVVRDDAKAVFLYRRACDDSNASACKNLDRTCKKRLVWACFLTK